MPIQFNTLCQESTLYEAWNTVKSKGSAGGVDGMTLEDFNKDKINQIKQLREELINREWKPQPYLQIAIPRMNYSVFECMLTDIQYKSMFKRLAKLVVRKEDWVNIYPLCTECYARIEYIPPVKKKEPVKIAVV